MKKYSKRDIVLICLGVCIVLFIGWVIWGNMALQTTHYTISSDKIPSEFNGFRIVQLSDLHNAEFGKGNQKLLRSIAELKPDILVITGDLVDCRKTDLEIASSFAREAVKIAPTYYITGNHEARIDDYPELEEKLILAGVTVLNDKSIILRQGSASIQLIGLHDPSFQNPGAQEEEILNGLKENMFSVLLAHNPEYLPLYANCGVDLVLSGHIHGGQFRVPFLGGLYAPGQGLFPKYDAGFYQKDETQMIISRGLGNSVFPFRINNRPEIVVIDLKSETR